MLTIAWDIDDVLNQLTRKWLECFWLPRHPQCLLNYENVTNNPPNNLLGITLDEYQQALDAFRLSGSYARMAPDPDIAAWFNAYGRFFRHMVLTAVPTIAAPVSAAWVFTHFGNWIRTFHFVPSFRSGDIETHYEKSKGDYLKWLDRVDIFIDDHPGHVQSAASIGLRTFLVSRPWNSGGMSVGEILGDLTSLHARG